LFKGVRRSIIIVVVFLTAVTPWLLWEVLAPSTDSLHVYNQDQRVFVISKVNQTSREILLEGHHSHITLPRLCYVQYVTGYSPPNTGKIGIDVSWSLTAFISADSLSLASLSVAYLILTEEGNELLEISVYNTSTQSGDREINVTISSSSYFSYNYTVYPTFNYLLAVRLYAELSGQSSITGNTKEGPGMLKIFDIEGLVRI
jgi:hypothetical protein